MRDMVGYWTVVQLRTVSSRARHVRFGSKADIHKVIRGKETFRIVSRINVRPYVFESESKMRLFRLERRLKTRDLNGHRDRSAHSQIAEFENFLILFAKFAKRLELVVAPPRIVKKFVENDYGVAH